MSVIFQGSQDSRLESTCGSRGGQVILGFPEWRLEGMLWFEPRRSEDMFYSLWLLKGLHDVHWGQAVEKDELHG